MLRHVTHMRCETYVRRVTYVRCMTHVRHMTLVKYVTYLKVSSCLLKVSWLRADVENRMVGGRLSTSCSQALYIALIYDR